MRGGELEIDFELRDFLPEKIIRELGYMRAKSGLSAITEKMEEIRNDKPSRASRIQ